MRAGDSWGEYNPIKHEWVVPPHNPKFLQQEQLTDKQAFISGSHVKRVPLPRTQGVYDPIKAEWKVLPSDIRAAVGLDFAPVSTFKNSRK